VRRARRANSDARIVVAGCSVQVHPEAFAAVDPAATLVGNDGKTALLDELAALVALPERPGGLLAAPLPTLSGVDGQPDPAAHGPIDAAHRPIDGIADDRTIADRTRAFVKVQDGCSFFCTYCIIPRARGAERSLPPATVLADVRRALEAGHREIVLTGINVGTYDGGSSERGFRGSHRRSALTLAGLVRRILDETDVERIRLSSIEPQHVDDELLAAWTDSGGRCLPHFHLPLQSGDDRVLRRMGRRYDSAGYAALVERIRRSIPEVAVHADVIAGFPGEDDAAFEATRSFLERIDPAGLHVFRYSARPGTAAVRMAGQVDERTRKERAAILLAAAAVARARFARRRVGSLAHVLFEEPMPDGRWVGHAEDHVLVAAAARDGHPLGNELALVELLEVDADEPDRLHGAIRSFEPPPAGLGARGAGRHARGAGRGARGAGRGARAMADGRRMADGPTRPSRDRRSGDGPTGEPAAAGAG
jgi:threonylcarbamoyladenosine tRNA methylthiotransferase MtaB